MSKESQNTVESGNRTAFIYQRAERAVLPVNTCLIFKLRWIDTARETPGLASKIASERGT